MTMRTAAGIALGTVSSVAVSLALLGARGESASVNVALALVLCVLLGALVGGRPAGVATSITGAAAFDLLHTQPYGRPQIARWGDVLTNALLLLVGLLAGELTVRSERIRSRLRDGRRAVTRLQRVTALAAAPGPETDVVDAVAEELRDLLGLRDCWFERPPFVSRFVELERHGTMATNVLRFTPDGFELDRGGVELPVVSGGHVLGRFVLVPTAGTGVSPERRVVAVALADQVAAVLTRRPAA